MIAEMTAQTIAHSNLIVILSSVTTIVAFGAFWVSWREVRRNNKPIVRLRDFTTSISGEVARLKVCIQNRGIALQAVSMTLNYTGPKKSGNINLPMQLVDYGHRLHGTFLRGTIAEFVLSTADDKDVELLRLMEEPKDQEPAICVRNNAYLLRHFSIYRRADRLRNLWNRLTFRMRWQRRVGEGREGKGVFKEVGLPRFANRPMHFELFLKVAGRCSAR